MSKACMACLKLGLIVIRLGCILARFYVGNVYKRHQHKNNDISMTFQKPLDYAPSSQNTSSRSPKPSRYDDSKRGKCNLNLNCGCTLKSFFEHVLLCKEI